MVWQPDAREPAAMFEGPVVQNCLTILTRDFKEALDYYYSGENLLDFQERTLGPPLRNVYPCIGVEPSRNAITEADDRSHLLEVVRVQINLAVTADGPSKVTELIMKYVRVTHLVLQNARHELVIGMSSPFGAVLLDFDHLFDWTREKNSIITRAAALMLSIGVRER